MKKDGQQAVRAGSGEKARELLMVRIVRGGSREQQTLKRADCRF
jgi:hypothetical protein